jgi:hypothetical protein
MAWPEGLQATWMRWPPPRATSSLRDHFMAEWGIPSAVAQRMLETDAPEDEAEIRKYAKARAREHFRAFAPFLLDYAPHFARKLLSTYATGHWDAAAEAFLVLAARHELAFLDPFLAFAATHRAEGLAVLLPYRSPRIAMLAADAHHRLKNKPAAARDWLLQHPEAAATGLIPSAVGAPGNERESAEYALRMLAREGHEGEVMRAATRYGDDAVEAVRAVLHFDPLQVFPSKLPALPEFAEAEALPRLVLRASGKALPAEAMQHVLTMLAISKVGEPYAGIAILKELATAASQRDLAWALFEAWQGAGADAKQSWALAAMGFFGDDECARRLTPLVRGWPGESQHQRALIGLDVLASIGSDVALMHLHGIAQKAKFKGLQEKASEKVEQIAAARGLSADELADRLVPDLGLGRDGSRTLDFGPRRFRVVFDESIKPFVQEEGGKRLAELPKPRATDDAAKSKEATETWKLLKQDAKAIAQQQVLRLERAMCSRRRWREDAFRAFLVAHPLMRHLVQRLVWAAYDAEGKLTMTFRVAEDGSYADANDAVLELPPGVSLGIAHPLEMQPGEAARFARIFSDYALLQPFKQLDRETFALTREEAARSSIAPWQGKRLHSRSVLGLEARGWRVGAQARGCVTCMERPMRDEEVLTLEFEPGIFLDVIEMEPEQQLIGLGVAYGWRLYPDDRKSLDAFDPIVISEALRDVALLLSSP